MKVNLGAPEIQLQMRNTFWGVGVQRLVVVVVVDFVGDVDIDVVDVVVDAVVDVTFDAAVEL